MKPIRITLSNRPGVKPMRDWLAFEVPDTDGLMAVHQSAHLDGQMHATRWSATHIPSGRSIPVPYWSGMEKAAWYAKEFFDEARRHGIDLSFADPLDGVPEEIRGKLRAVCERTPPDSIPSYVQKGVLA